MPLPSRFFSFAHHLSIIVACSKDWVPIIQKRSEVFRNANFIVEYDREYDNQTKEWICKQ